MDKYEKMKSELEELVNTGSQLFDSLKPDENNKEKDLKFFLTNYEGWYSQALRIISAFLPERKDDFSTLYHNSRRKELTVGTYTISDALKLMYSNNNSFAPRTAALLVYRQKEMLRVCLDSFDSTIWNIQTILQADIFDSEIESAKHLLKRGFLRAAGAICGVLIEKHFSEVCKNHGVVIRKKTPTIADYNDALKDNVYDTIEWRKTQRLGDIRNLCDHNKDREPTKEEVEELIAGTEHVIKSIF